MFTSHQNEVKQIYALSIYHKSALQYSWLPGPKREAIEKLPGQQGANSLFTEKSPVVGAHVEITLLLI